MKLSPTPFEYKEPAGGWKGLQHLPDDLSTLPQYTLVFVVDPAASAVLYGLKRRGFGVNLYNGFGGKPETGESMRACARRELEEESGLVFTEKDMMPLGTLVISQPRVHALSISLYGCIRTRLQGSPTPTEEMIPEWFDIPKDLATPALPWDQMWPESRLYQPHLIKQILEKSTTQLQGYVEYHNVPGGSFDSSKYIDPKPASPSESGYALAGWSFAAIPQ